MCSARGLVFNAHEQMVRIYMRAGPPFYTRFLTAYKVFLFVVLNYFTHNYITSVDKNHVYAIPTPGVTDCDRADGFLKIKTATQSALCQALYLNLSAKYDNGFSTVAIVINY